MVDQPPLIEIADKFLHREFLPQSLDPPHTVLRVAEDPYVPINALEGDLLYPGLQLLIRFVALDWGIGQWLDQLVGQAEEVHEARLTLLARLPPACGDMDGKGQGNILLCPGFEGVAVHPQVLTQLVRRIDQR